MGVGFLCIFYAWGKEGKGQKGEISSRLKREVSEIKGSLPCRIGEVVGGGQYVVAFSLRVYMFLCVGLYATLKWHSNG
jgi:hypothetical protein